jgi:photosystem II stability/assembly factor-like uncharacterized protein
MNKTAAAFDAPPREIASDSPPPTHDAESLFKEARRRRRRRRAAATAGVLFVVAIVVVSVLETGRGSTGPSRVGQGHPRSPQPVAQPGHHAPTAATPLPVYPPAQMIGTTGSSLAWAATGATLEISSDAGQTWRTVTPPTLQGVSVSIKITAVDAIGTDALWVGIYDVPGLVVPNGGSSRGEGIDHSIDGGKSWSFITLPSCLQECGPISLSMVDAQNGFAVASGVQGQSALVFSTHDGGTTWTQIATMPSLGGVDVGGPLEGSQLLFTSDLDGWAVPGPSDGTSSEPQSPGGVIYRTTDGGLSWSAVSGLPVGLHYTLPVFFGPQDAVTLATEGTQGDQDPAVFATQDGGTTWTRYPIPAFVGSQFQPGSFTTRFAAVGLLNWKVDTGSKLYETTDGGKTWTSSKPRPKVGLGDVAGIEFSSPSFGMAIEQNPVCFTKAAVGSASYECYPVLTITSDGGRQWTPAKL